MQSRSQLATAEAFIDGFYSFEPESLGKLIATGPDAESILYYQAWAEAAHYQVLERQPCIAATAVITCAITVSDDFGSVLGYTATDTFTLRVNNERVENATFVGDDPPVFQALFEWLKQHHPEVLTGPCKDLFADGKTPGDCARAVAAGARAYRSEHSH